MYSYLKCVVYDKLLKPRQSFRITLHVIAISQNADVIYSVVNLYIIVKYTVTLVGAVQIPLICDTGDSNFIRFKIRGKGHEL